VKSIGSGVTRFRPGDRVFGVTFFGAYAPKVTVIPFERVAEALRWIESGQSTGKIVLQMT